MEKDELVREILEKVQDEKLRDELLRQLGRGGAESAADGAPPRGDADKGGPTTEAMRDYLSFQWRIGVMVGYFTGGLFTALGTLGVAANVAQGDVTASFIFGILWIMGLLIIVSTNRMKQALQSRE